jgi:hypothetical protein
VSTAAASIVVDAATGGINIIATPAELAGAYALGWVVGFAYGAYLDIMAEESISDPCLLSKGKGERGWGKRRGDDPLWGETVEELKKIEKNHPDPNVRENAKRIRKMKEKEKGKPTN